MTYYQIIIQNGENPDIYFIDSTKVDKHMEERMINELGNYPFWCYPIAAYEKALCDIKKIGELVDSFLHI